MCNIKEKLMIQFNDAQNGETDGQTDGWSDFIAHCRNNVKP